MHMRRLGYVEGRHRGSQPLVTTPVRGPALPKFCAQCFPTGVIHVSSKSEAFAVIRSSALGAITYLITTRSILAKSHTGPAVVSPVSPSILLNKVPHGSPPYSTGSTAPFISCSTAFRSITTERRNIRYPTCWQYSISTSANPNPGLPSPAAGSRSRCQMVVLAWPLGPTNPLSQPGAFHLAFVAGAFCTSPWIPRPVLHLCTQLKSPARVVP